MITYSIIQKSQLEGANRLDAEYYQPEYLKAADKIRSMRHDSIGNIISILTDYHANGSYQILRNNVSLLDNPNFAYMVRAIDLQTSNFNSDVKYVTKDAYEFLKKTKIFGGEIIIDKIGNAGEVYFMPKLDRPVTLGMNLFMVRPRKGISPEYLYSFLTSKFGRALIFQKVTGTVPLSIDKNSVRSILIPYPPKEVELEVINAVTNHFKLINDSNNFYQQAEKLLLGELGLWDFEPREDLSFIANLSEITEANRVDADFFQPKYKELILKLKSQNSKPFTRVVENIAARFSPKPDDEYKYVELANINSSIGVIDGYSEIIGKEAPSRAKRILKTGDVIVSNVEGSLEKIALVDADHEESLASTGFFQFGSKEILPEVLLVLAKSIVLQMQLKQHCAGTILMAVQGESLEKMIVPVLPKGVQEKIADLVRKSHEARKKSNEHLEEAKRKVEEMIEKGGEN